MLNLSSTLPPIPAARPVKIGISNSRPNHPQDMGDTFTRTQSVRFASSSQSLGDLSDSSDDESTPPDQIWGAIRHKGQIPASLPVLGRGMESVVYKVSDQFVFRVPIRYEGTNWDFRREQIEEHPDEHQELRRIHNIGRPVAKVYVDQEPIFFHKLMRGEKASINYNRLTLGGSIPEGEEDTFNEKYRAYLEAISQFPEKSYQNLLWPINKLDRAKKAIDPGANNLMVDVKRQRFSLVDYKATEEAFENGMFPANEHNNMAYVMAMLVDMQYKAQIRGNNNPDAHEQALCRTILEKTLLAAAHLKYTQDISVKLPNSETFHLKHVNDKSCNSFTPQETFEACGLQAFQWEAVRKSLQDQKAGNHGSYRVTVESIKRNLRP